MSNDSLLSVRDPSSNPSFEQRDSGRRALSLSFSNLYDRISSPLLKSDDALQLFSKYLPAILRVFLIEPYHGDNEFSVRFDESSTLPLQPSASEISHASTVASSLGLCLADASLLLRDFLTAVYGKKQAGSIISRDDRIVSAAPVDDVQRFWEKETENAFLCLARMYLMAKKDTESSYSDPLSLFVDAQDAFIRPVVERKVHDILRGCAKRKEEKVSSMPNCSKNMLKLFFSIICSRGIVTSALVEVIGHFADIAQTAWNNRFIPRQYLSHLKQRCLLDDCYSSLYICAAMILGFSSLGTGRHASVIAKSCGSAVAIAEREDKQNLDTTKLLAIDCALKKTDGSEYMEVAIVRIFWSSFFANSQHVRNHFASDPSESSHFQYAARLNVFEVLHALLRDLQAHDPDEVLEGAVRNTLWDSMNGHLHCYPPTSFPRTTRQFTEEIDCAVAILSIKGFGPASIAAVSLWENEYSPDGMWSGANNLLRSACLLFPFRFRPLILLLNAMCTDSDSSMEVVKTLSQRLHTRAESASTYSSRVHPVSVEEVSVIKRKAFTSSSNSLRMFFRSIDFVAQKDEKSKFVFVQPRENLKSPYGDLLEAGTGLGLLNATDSSVMWACRWNGWRAVELTLESLKSLLSHSDADFSYEATAIAELIDASVVSMDLISKVCRLGTGETREQMSLGAVPVQLVCDLFAAAAQPRGNHGSWMSNDSRAILLRSAGVCLHAMTLCSSQRSRIVLDRLLFPQAHAGMFQACLSSLGESAFPALASIALLVVSAYPLETLGNSVDLLFSSLPNFDSDGESCHVAQISEVIRLVALPAWLGLHDGALVLSRFGDTHWLLPAAAMDMLRLCPENEVNTPVVVAAVAAVLTAALVNVVDKRAFSQFYYYALRNSLALCRKVLQYRTAALDDPEVCNDIVRHPDNPSNALPFENMLLTPEVVGALAVISSGSSSIVKDAAIIQEHQNSELLSLVACESDYLDRVSGIEDMAAQCLSLHMICLAKVAKHRDKEIVQIPWPSQDSLQRENLRGGENLIRSELAEKIRRSESPFTIDMLSTVVSCGQRAIARSLFAPATPIFGRIDIAKETSGGREMENAILSAVVNRLSLSIQLWNRAVTTTSSTISQRSIGILVYNIASCTRFLRIVWEVYGAIWLKHSWISLGVWDVLGNILRCGPSNSKHENFNIAVALESRMFRFAAGSEGCGWNLRPENLSSTVAAIDSSSVWRGAVSDILEIFTSEVVLRSGDLIKMSKDSRSCSSDSGGISGKDQSDANLKQEVFKDPAFVSLRDSFTEHWMHVFLDLSHVDVLSSASGKSMYDFRGMSIEDMFLRIAEDFCSVVGKDVSHETSGQYMLQFRHKGQVRPLFGTNYVFCLADIARQLHAAEISEARKLKILENAALLNMRWSRIDSQLCLTKAFSCLTMMVVMADTVAPAPGMTLTYASPQYCGKLCRVIAHALTSSGANATSSLALVNIHVELTRLLGFVSARLSTEELDQAALSAMRLPVSLRQESSAVSRIDGSPVSEITTMLERYSHSLRLVAHNGRDHRLEAVRWLLLSGARLIPGPAFRNDDDLVSFRIAAIASMRAYSFEPAVCSSASAALSSVVTSLPGDAETILKSDPDLEVFFTTVANLCSKDDENVHEHILAASGVLSFLVKLVTTGPCSRQSKRSCMTSLAHLSSGCIAALLPSGEPMVPAYLVTSGDREPVHRLWCSLLTFAASLTTEPQSRTSSQAEESEFLDGVVEFARSNYKRISSASLDSAGDWPPAYPPNDSHARHPIGRHITLARVEEAELAMKTVFALASHSTELRNAAPYALKAFIELSLRLTYQTYRLIRAEPLDRWIRPVSKLERELCENVQTGTDYNALSSGQLPGFIGSPWPISPTTSPRGPTISSPSPRRTPQQALRAALGGLSNKGSAFSSTPPSPGMPSTPQHQSPMLDAMTARSALTIPKYQSPMSPWDAKAVGLISAKGRLYLEEVTVSVLHALSSALAALRRFCTSLDIPLFAPTMNISEHNPSIGLLVGIQFHACTEIQRGAEGERRNTMLLMIESALHISLAHAAYYGKSGELTPGIRDEIHKRIDTVITRMRRIVPPAPSYSIIHSREVDNFLSHFKIA